MWKFLILRRFSFVNFLILISTADVYQLSIVRNQTRFSTLIGKLTQSSHLSNGFGFRVSAVNSRGVGSPSQTVFVKPKGLPLPPQHIDLTRDVSSSTSVSLYFIHVTHPENRGSDVNSYLIEYGLNEDFFDARKVKVSAQSLLSCHRSVFQSDGKKFLHYSIENLKPGDRYFVRVASISEVGRGSFISSTPDFVIPGGKPSPMEESKPAYLSTLSPGPTTSVAASSSSLEINWRPPASNGFEVTSYLIEYWTEHGKPEVHEVKLYQGIHSTDSGSWYLTYNKESTDSLCLNATAKDVEKALMSFHSLRKVHVDKLNSNDDYTWRITFFSEYPSMSGNALEVTTQYVSAETVSNDFISSTVQVVQTGVTPKNYREIYINATNVTSQMSHSLKDLVSGQVYFVQISAGNKLGYGVPRSTVPESLSPPKQRPSQPRNISLSLDSGTSLSVSFKYPESDGGDAILHFKIEWDGSTEFNSENGSPEGSYTYILTSNDSCNPCKHIIRGLSTGKLYYVRVAAYNSYGYSLNDLSHHAESPKHIPHPPRVLYVNSTGSQDLYVSFPKSDTEGGENVTKYKVQWKNLFSGLDSESLGDRMYFQNGVQSIAFESYSHDVFGGFYISFEGLISDEFLPITASAQLLKEVLENIPTVGTVIVTKLEGHYDWKWFITFLSYTGHDNGIYGSMSKILVSVDSNPDISNFGDVVEASNSSVLVSGSRLIVAHEVQSYSGFEQQTFSSYCKTASASLYGSFNLLHGHLKSKAISFNSTSAEFEESMLEMNFGSVNVKRGYSSGAANSFIWTVIFLEKLGDLPLLEFHSNLICTDNNPGFLRAQKVSSGRIPALHENDTYIELPVDDFEKRKFELLLGSLSPDKAYHFNVRAWNGVRNKYGPAQYSNPALISPILPPDSPTRVAVQSSGPWHLSISWEEGLSLGGALSLSKYRVKLTSELDNLDVEVSSKREIQAIRLRGSASDIKGYFTLHFMNQYSKFIDVNVSNNELKEILEGFSTIHEVEVSKVLISQECARPWQSYGIDWFVTFSSRQGNAPSLLVSTGAGPGLKATGGTIKGSKPLIEVVTLSEGGLHRSLIVRTNQQISSSTWTVEVSAFNGHYWSDSSAYEVDLTFPGKLPTPPLNVVAQVLSDSDVVISWEYPSNDEVMPVTGFSIQWDTSLIFDYKDISVERSALDAFGNHLSYVVSGIPPGKEFFFRVLARNSNGFSAGVVARKSQYRSIFATIMLESESQITDTSLQFKINVTKGSSFKVSEPISLYSEDNLIEASLNSLHMGFVTSIKREEHSTTVNGSGINTPFHVNFHLSVIGREPDSISVISDTTRIQTHVLHNRSPTNKVMPSLKPPGFPMNVSIHVVSKTEIGVKWEVPIYDGGLLVTHYLVEWSKYPDFNTYSNEVSRAIAETTSFQIKGLHEYTRYYVRVSAGNSKGYSDALSSDPEYVTTADVLLYIPTDITLSISPSDIPNRLLLVWSQPISDSNGFSTSHDQCGVSVGSSVDPASSYIIEWSTEPSMKNSSFYEYFTKTVEKFSLCCPKQKCSLDIGTEVQTITLRSTRALTNISIRVLYLGSQGPSATVVATNGSDRIRILGYSGNRRITVGDFIKISSYVYRIVSSHDDEVILDSDFHGADFNSTAFFNAPPMTCFNTSHNTAEDMATHISLNFDDSPFEESIRVSSRRSLNGMVLSYDISFIGPSFSTQTEELLILSSKSSGSIYDTYCDSINPNALNEIDVSDISVVTRMDSLSLNPGKPYFVKISAKNSVGTGVQALSKPSNIAPKSSAYLPQQCQVSIVPRTDDALSVTWRGVAPYSGEDPISYRIDFISNEGVESIDYVEAINESSKYSFLKRSLVPGSSYEVLITPINSLGIGGPKWFENVTSSENISVIRIRDYEKRACYAVPACPSSNEECIEDGGGLILLRSLPKAPLVKSVTNTNTLSEERFSKNSIHLSFSHSPLNDRYKIELSTDDNFRNSTFFETNNTEYVLSSLIMGQLYYFRVRAHNSAGYGAPSKVASVQPMTIPDPPKEPKLGILPLSYIPLERSTSLFVTWDPPRIDALEQNEVGNGGSDVDRYLLEWSNIDWSTYSKQILKVRIGNASDEFNLRKGSFRLKIDSTSSACSTLRAIYTSSRIPANVTAEELSTIIQNVPNSGAIQIDEIGPSEWNIEFLNHISANLTVTVVDNEVLNSMNSVVSIDIQNLVLSSNPTDFRYFCSIVTASVVSQSQHTITGLLPGHSYFVRVSSGNLVGYGKPRSTIPAALGVPLSKPLLSLSKYHSKSSPNLRALSASEILVEFGPPAFNGGSRLTSFVIEWDDSASFDSPLGRARKLASENICSNCILTFHRENNTFYTSGGGSNKLPLLPQQKISIFFPDEDFYHDFEILSVHENSFEVSNHHLRSTSFYSFVDENGLTGGNLFLVGGELLISNLESNTEYFVRVYAENAALGAGKAANTSPPSVKTHYIPVKPFSVTASAINKSSLRVQWIPPKDKAALDGYVVEAFSSRNSFDNSESYYGSPAVITLDTTGLGVKGGFFILQYGREFVALEGIRGSMSKGSITLITTYDITPLLPRESEILIKGQVFRISPKGEFSSTRVTVTEEANTDFFDEQVFTRILSHPIRFDADEDEISRSIKAIAGANIVRRESMHPDGFLWTVSFIDIGEKDHFEVITRYLEGEGRNSFSFSYSKEGKYPFDYHKIVLKGDTATDIDLPNLQTGTPYLVSVRSSYKNNWSPPTFAAYASVPAGGPDEPRNARLESLDHKRLLLTFESPSNDNGSPIYEYLIQISESSNFASSFNVTVPFNSCIQRLSSSSYTSPWKHNSSFSLSLGDYRGDFTVDIFFPSLVKADKGSQFLIRSLGQVNLSDRIHRNSHLSVGGFEFTVCVDNEFEVNETHIPLCRHDDPERKALYDGTSVNNATIYGFNTYLGMLHNISIGNSYVYTYDTSDIIRSLKRGDFIMIGDPKNGQEIRISTDLSRPFTSDAIPLADTSDPYVNETVSFKGVKYSSYEIQEIMITSKFQNDDLISSSERLSSYRLQFDAEITKYEGVGGADGCIPWDGSANDLKIQLESLKSIDTVRVSKHFIDFTDTHGNGVKYKVTFIGQSVRGNVPLLKIMDMGTNGCMDAYSTTGKKFDDYGSIKVSTVETSTTPFYRMQKSNSISYDASSSDIEAALESLAQTCKVRVNKEIGINGNVWDTTFYSFGGQLCCRESSLPRITPIEEKTFAEIGSSLLATPVYKIPIPVAKTSVPYYIRIASVNGIGQSNFIQSNPRVLEASYQSPGIVRDLYAEPISDTEIMVQWESPENDGGSRITHFKVDYDDSLTLDSGMNGASLASKIVHSDEINPIFDVQSVSIMIAHEAGNDIRFLSGTFSLSFDGQETSQIPYDAQDLVVQGALEELCTVRNVTVSRSSICIDIGHHKCAVEGFTWLVTFNEPGDQRHRTESEFRSKTLHRLSVDGTYLMACENSDLSSCYSNENRIKAWIGTKQEIQEIQLGSSDFTVQLYNDITEPISIGMTLDEVEEKLSDVMGRIDLYCIGCDNFTLKEDCTIGIKFNAMRGDVPLLQVSDPTVEVTEIQKGLNQYVVGRSTYSTVIKLPSISNRWYIRVYAYNKHGGGNPTNASPFPITTKIRPPSVVRRLSVANIDSNSVMVSWDSPIYSGGANIDHFLLSYDTTMGFTSSQGEAMKSISVPVFKSDNHIGVVLENFAYHPIEEKRKQIIVDDISLISNSIIASGSYIRIEEENFLVIHTGQCGESCIVLDRTTETLSQHSKIYLGSDSFMHLYVITDLTPGTKYYIKIASVNTQNLTSEWAYSHDIIPSSVPEVIEKGGIFLLE